MNEVLVFANLSKSLRPLIEFLKGLFFETVKVCAFSNNFPKNFDLPTNDESLETTVRNLLDFYILVFLKLFFVK